MFGLLPAVALALLAVDAQAMKLDFLRFPRRALDSAEEHALYKRAPTYITNFTLPDTNYTYIGCYTDTTAKRAFAHELTDSIPGGAANMTVANCARAANVTGYVLFGIEYSQECWAGWSLDPSSMLRSNASCSMPCKGNSSEYCGNGDYLQTYQLTSNITEIEYFKEAQPTTTTAAAPVTTPDTQPATTTATATTGTATATGIWHALGCYEDLKDYVRVFTDQVNDQVTGGAAAMTNELCQATCGKLGFPFAGTEYYGECFCSSKFNGDNGIQKSADCNTPCRGDASQMCGGPNRVSAWGFGDARGPAPVPEPVTTTASSSTSTTAESTTTSPSTGVMGWKYMGCLTDQVGGVRALDQGLIDLVPGGVANMTNANCQAACLQRGFKYCGTEWSQECFGSSTIAGENKLAAEADCSNICTGKPGEKCGGSSRLSAWEYGPIAAGDTTTIPVASTTTTSATVANPSPTSSTKEWKSLGCYFDGQGGRALPNGHADEVPGGYQNMTNVGCTSTCEKLGFTLAGTEYSGECFCASEFHGENGPAPPEDCNMPCYGNASEFCGSGNRLTAWQLVDAAVPESTTSTTTSTTSTEPVPETTPTVAPSSTSTTEIPSNSTSTTATELPSNSTSTSTSELPANSTATSTEPSSNSTTIGTPTETANSTSIPTDAASSTSAATSTEASVTTSSTVIPSPTPTIILDGWNALGCYYDAQGGRALSNQENARIPGGAANVTNQNCQDACRQAGFVYSGQEYSQECWCGNAILFQNGPAPAADCNMPCAGSKEETCGSGNRLTLFGFGTANGTAGTEPVPTTPTVPTVPAGPAPTQPGNLPGNWTYAGCYIDNANGRILPNQVPDSANLTSANCINECTSLGFKVAGTQYGAQCFCANALYGGAALTDESQCSMSCSGNSFEKCGAGNRMSVFSTGNLTAYAPPTAANSSGNWTYVGCWTDNLSGKLALKWQIPESTNNSAEVCLAHCHEFGYMTGGLQYGKECSCGDWSSVVPSGSTLRSDTECDMPCTGDGTQICGGPNRFSMYNWTGTPLYEWAEPQGADRGEYSMMVGGLVIPLIATLGINNKVTFLEKHGTGAPNSTGAYELDPSQVGNPAAAWRELNGLKTDVFCAASVTLPDKAGRQLNIGGWSTDSLYGVRLFTPDGSEGVKGVNDWEENFNEIALQRGRWYPTAMTMANGSVLVVGGEHGSNGVAEPTLEILPNPPGGQYLYMEWLARTDPFNLYPFMYVLPSGGIFVAYYNEARILDPVTFATRNQLPNMPGSIVAADAGRTYPLEGTAMMFPQHAPYSDPVTILMCGGADIIGRALDNCVSIQPEVGGAQWTIERMPTPRVMTNMVNLPDGRFVIMGGAKQGHAGFGLAQDPNNQAVLYDPSKPLHARMSMMGTTDIARMYHSETILLPDGSVMVTGSDPQDNLNPQEYRMERFSPDYMQNGRPKPSFSLASGTRGDWSYGGSYSFSVNMPSGGTPRVSLMGAVSATHGASMGQRHYFPAVSCGGNQCTVTAPPTPEICVPGWYQMFVLDGPTPSMGQWVRIGGDPADTGSWPNTKSFHPPGRG